MKLVCFSVETPIPSLQRIGALVKGDLIVDLNSVYQEYLRSLGTIRAKQIADALLPDNLLDFILGGSVSLKAAKDALDYFDHHLEQEGNSSPTKFVFKTKQVKLEAPIRPGKLLCLSHNFYENDAPRGAHEAPLAFLKSPSVIVGPDDVIIYPKITKELDYELEVALIIGKAGKNIPKNKWKEYVFGYTIFNDVSARDLQASEMKKGVLNLGKNLDTFAPLGPCITTADEIPDPHNLDMELRVNGQVRQKSNTKNMISYFDEAISYLSQDQTLYPGDLICSGCPSGFARGSTQPELFYLKPKDAIEAAIENIGILRNVLN